MRLLALRDRHPAKSLMKNLNYRPDIDGLRAIAVMSVVLFHLDLPIHGGFVGVDIFFTISGYLIGSIILKESESGRFSFSRFYERRIRRIFPALFAMLAVSSMLAYRVLLPAELEDYAQSVAASVASVSNFLFWSRSGYFDAASNGQPLLHTWSLSVEEQFYLFLPVFVVGLRKYRPAWLVPALYAVAMGSFVMSAYLVSDHRTATFYSPATRAWELLVGTLLAVHRLPGIEKRWCREALAFVGSAAIAGTAFLYNGNTPFPGPAALIPCLGAALIIAAGAGGPTIIGNALSWRPVVGVGLISYSVYLWHWPLIVFQGHGLTIFKGLSRNENQFANLCLALVAGALSWWLVETPFRRGQLLAGRKAVFAGAATLAAIAVMLSTGVLLSSGYPERFPRESQELAKWIGKDPLDPVDSSRNGSCFITAHSATLKDFDRAKCLTAKPGALNVLILGDSHAASLWWGLNQVLVEANVMQATASGCKPVLTQRPRQFRHCKDVIDFILKDYLLQNRVDVLVIEARWEEGDLESLGETLAWLRLHSVPTLLVGPNVQYDTSLPRLLAIASAQATPELPRQHRLKFVAGLDREMARRAASTWQVPYHSLLDTTCTDEQCQELLDHRVPMLLDYGHLTKNGSIWIATRMKKQLVDTMQRQSPEASN